MFLPVFSTSIPDGALCPGTSATGSTIPDVYCTGDWVGPNAGLDSIEGNSLPTAGFGTSGVQPLGSIAEGLVN